MNEIQRPDRASGYEEDDGDDDLFEDEGPDCYVVLPVADEPGHWVAVFADGSYVKDWAPLQERG